MIDEDFQPHRLQLRALGHLLLNAQNFPNMPFLREVDLYERVYEQYIGALRQEWLRELAEYKLVYLIPDGFKVGDALGSEPWNVYITPAGIYYSISRASIFSENARTPTDDFPDQIVDAPWAIQSYFSPDAGTAAPASDRYVKFDDNEVAYDEAIGAIDALVVALHSDNSIGAEFHEVRDEKLDELRAIRELLEKKEGWVSKILATAWITFAFLMSQFATRPVGYLADEAWRALQVVLGLK